jgi:UDP-glucose:(heptosyl)LPS alpha-1,3-glucosyltransferase
MRIALIRRNFRVDGGAERALLNYLNAYIAAGHSVVLICESWEGALDSRVQVMFVSTCGGRWMRNRGFRIGVMRILDGNAFDRVQSHEWIPGVDIVRLGDGLHSSWINRLAGLRSFWGRLLLGLSLFHHDRLVAERKTLMHPNLRNVIVNSEMVADEVRRAYPKLRARLRVQYNAVPDSFFRLGQSLLIPDAEIRLLFVGSGWERKGLEMAIHVIASCQFRISLAVIGRDKHQSKYVNLARALGVSEFVNFYGVLSMSEAIYRQFDALILPTLYDPFPNVAAEALASGIPVLTSSGCGAVDFRSDGSVLIADTLSEYCRHVVTLTSSNRPVVDRQRYRQLFSDQRLLDDLQDIVR